MASFPTSIPLIRTLFLIALLLSALCLSPYRYSNLIRFRLLIDSTSSLGTPIALFSFQSRFPLIRIAIVYPSRDPIRWYLHLYNNSLIYLPSIITSLDLDPNLYRSLDIYRSLSLSRFSIITLLYFFSSSLRAIHIAHIHYLSSASIFLKLLSLYSSDKSLSIPIYPYPIPVYSIFIDRANRSSIRFVFISISAINSPLISTLYPRSRSIVESALSTLFDLSIDSLDPLIFFDLGYNRLSESVALSISQIYIAIRV